MICQDCGVEAATRHVSFHQNIGALFVRFSNSVSGDLCKNCLHKHFWGMTTKTLFLGWWGTVSLIVTPFFLLNNVGRYLLCLRMPAVPPGATPPLLTDDVVERIRPHAADLFGLLNAGAEFAGVATSIAHRAGVTPGQVALFVQAVVRSQQQQQ